NASQSRSWYRDLSRGHFAGVATTMQGVFSVRYDNITYPAPGAILVRDGAGATIDSHNLSNYRINNYTSVKRTFELKDTAFSLKAGAAIRSEDRDNRRNNETYTFVGADGVANTAD